VREGYDEIQHMNMLFPQFPGRHAGDAHADAVHRRSAGTVRSGSRIHSVRAFLQAAQRPTRTVIDATVATFGAMYGPAGQHGCGAQRSRRACRRKCGADSLLGRLAQSDSGADALSRGTYAKMLAFVKKLYRLGIPIVAGTDTWPAACTASSSC